MSARSPRSRSTARPARSACTTFFVAHDCGQIINPDGVQNQIEGNVIQTVSRTLMEELKFDRSTVTSLDWASYPILTFPEVPEIVIDLIDRPNEKPWGAGEPVGRGGAVGDLERGVRRDRRAAALGAVHAGQGPGGNEGCGVMRWSHPE